MTEYDTGVVVQFRKKQQPPPQMPRRIYIRRTGVTPGEAELVIEETEENIKRYPLTWGQLKVIALGAMVEILEVR